jgi:hypothetical protein
MDTITKWVLTYIMDGKRLTAALIAVLNLATPKLVEWGIPLPEGATTTAASFLAIAILTLWSKLSAKKAT